MNKQDIKRYFCSGRDIILFLIYCPHFGVGKHRLKTIMTIPKDFKCDDGKQLVDKILSSNFDLNIDKVRKYDHVMYFLS